MFRVLAVLLAVAGAIKPSADNNNVGLSSHQRHNVLQFTSRLRFCNAYVPAKDQEDEPLDVMVEMVGREDIKLTETPLKFKECRDFARVNLAEGYRFSVRQAGGNRELAEFIVTQFDHTNDPLLMLVISRKSMESTEALFTSHQYSKLKNSQIAVMDLYQGSAKRELSIRSTTKDQQGRLHMEDLTPNSVMAFDAGKEYEVVLKDEEEREQAARFYAEGGQDYLMLSVGREGSGAHDEPELVFFPSAASRPVVCAAIAGIAAFFF